MRTQMIGMLVVGTLGCFIGAGVTFATAARGGSQYFGSAFASSLPAFYGFDSHKGAFGDIDGDGLADHVYLGGGASGSPILTFAKNDGFGTFVVEASVDTSSWGLSPYQYDSVDIVDVDGDGINEIVLRAGQSDPSTIVIVQNALAPWQPAPERAADFDGNQVVDGSDLAFLLAAWGPVTPAR